MTDDHARENAALSFAKAKTAIAAAKVLAAAAMCDDAVSRAYYAAFHAAQALLVSSGIEARSQAGVHSLLWEHFVQPGIVTRRLGKDLSALQKYREDADYDAVARFDAETGADEIERADRILDEIRDVLKARLVTTE